MGGLAAAIRSAVEVLDSQTASLQVNVTHEAWLGQDGYGKPVYAAGISRLALVQEGGSIQHRQQPNGDVIAVKACISFLRPITPNGAPGRHEPVDPRDRITLPSGLSGPVVEAPGAMVNPETGRPLLSVFWLK